MEGKITEVSLQYKNNLLLSILNLSIHSVVLSHSYFKIMMVILNRTDKETTSVLIVALQGLLYMLSRDIGMPNMELLSYLFALIVLKSVHLKMHLPVIQVDIIAD